MLEINYYIPKVENSTDLFTNIYTIADDIYNNIIPIKIKIGVIFMILNFHIVK